jgi:GGDEF domain-containing protein
MSVAQAIDRARDALASIAVHPDEPMRLANVAAQRGLELKPDVGRLLSHLMSRAPGVPGSATRYRWELNHQRVDPPAYAGPVSQWKAWRPAEQAILEQDPVAFEERLTLPILVAETTHLLMELEQQKGSLVDTTPGMASKMLAEADPILRRDLAQSLQMVNSWVDTFFLFCLTQRPQALQRHRPLALALATSYATQAQSGYLKGSRYPFHEMPLVSATAHLASALLGLGYDFDLLGRLVNSLRKARRPSGGFGDAQQPEDVLTSLAAAQVLGGLDPEFDPQPTQQFFMQRQEPTGFFRALGPEVPWLTARVAHWLQHSQGDFANRFCWPATHDGNADRKTGIAGFQYFLELCQLLLGSPCLAKANLPFAFIDLVGFRAFNNTCGQDAGDQALEECASFLSEVSGSKIIRDGGDEFLVVGAPTRGALLQDLLDHRQSWPARFYARFGEHVPLVRMRALVGHVSGRRLREARETLGRRIGELKEVKEDGGAVMREVGQIA